MTMACEFGVLGKGIEIHLSMAQKEVLALDFFIYCPIDLGEPFSFNYR